MRNLNEGESLGASVAKCSEVIQIADKMPLPNSAQYLGSIPPTASPEPAPC